ncbi:WD40 repeat-like protein [Amanita muscaria]
MKLQEIILSASAPSSSGSGSGSVSLHDIQTGSVLASFKQTSPALHCTAAVETRDSLGGFLLSCQRDKPILNVYNFQKDQISLKVVLPEKLSCIAVDKQGTYCAGATAQGRIYLWEVASGIMYNSWDAHYRRINVLRFTHDGAALLSGSEDSGVSVWSISRLLDDDTQNQLPLPYCSLSDHTLPVTDIVCGVGNFPMCRVLTSSMDHSVKIWDLSSKSLLTTFQYPQAITALAWDWTERLFFAASPDGSIHQTNLFRQHEDRSGLRTLESIGGAGASDVVRIDETIREAQKKRLISIGQEITCMSISLTSALLFVGTAAGLVHLIDIPTHQQLRTISTHKGFSITHLQVVLKPSDLVGHVDLSLYVRHGSDPKESIPVRPILAFQKMRDPKARENHDVSLMLPNGDQALTKPIIYTMDELLRDQSFFLQSKTTPGANIDDATTLKARTTELENEVEQLKTQLGRAKSINDAMWDNLVQRIVINEKAGDVDGGEGDDERKRKRSRT